MGNTRYFLSYSRVIPVFPAGMGNTHKSRDFANPGNSNKLFCQGNVIYMIICRTVTLTHTFTKVVLCMFIFAKRWAHCNYWVY